MRHAAVAEKVRKRWIGSQTPETGSLAAMTVTVTVTGRVGRSDVPKENAPHSRIPIAGRSQKTGRRSVRRLLSESGRKTMRKPAPALAMKCLIFSSKSSLKIRV